MAARKPIGPLEWLRTNRPGSTVRDFLNELYVERGFSTREIAEMTGTGVRGWHVHIKKLGLVRPLSEARARFWRSQRGQVIKEKSFRRVWSALREPRAQLTGIQRKLLWLRQGDKCPVCGKDLERYLTRIHHVKAQVMGGPDSLANLVALCFRCHDLIHLGDIDTVVALRDAFYRCFFCGSPLGPDRLVAVSTPAWRSTGKPEGTPFEVLACRPCLDHVGTGETAVARAIGEVLGVDIG